MPPVKPAKPVKHAAASSADPLNMVKINLPDGNAKSVPRYKTFDLLVTELITKKFNLGKNVIPNEFRIYDSFGGTNLMMNINENPDTAIKEGRDGHTWLLRRAIFLKDSAKIRIVKGELSNLDQFNLSQIKADFPSCKLIYPIKNILHLQTWLLAEKYGKFDGAKHLKMMEGDGIFYLFPQYVRRVNEWIGNKANGDEPSYGLTCIEGFDRADRSNLSKLMKGFMVKEWSKFSQTYKPEEIQVKASLKILQFAYDLGNEGYTHIYSFLVKVKCDYLAQILPPEVYLGVGPTGVTFFDQAYLVTRFTYHFEDINEYDYDGDVLILKTEDGIESRYESPEAQEIFNLIDQYISEQQYSNECEQKELAKKAAEEQKLIDKAEGLLDDEEGEEDE